jgi:hypothetical protein
MINNFVYASGKRANNRNGMGEKYVLSGSVWERWKDYRSFIKTRGGNFPDITQDILIAEIDCWCESLPGTKYDHIYIDVSNGYGDLENCIMNEWSKVGDGFMSSGIYQIGE